MGATGFLSAAFKSWDIQTQTAVAVVGGNVPTTLGMNVPDGLLSPQVFAGKDVVIPVEVTGVDPSAGTQVAMLYSISGPQCPPSVSTQTTSITFEPESTKPNSLLGTAVIPLQNLQCIQSGGTLNYWFQAKVGAQTIALSPSGHAQPFFSVQLVNSLTFAVTANNPCAMVPDTFLPDGKTSLCFPSGAISGPATVVVTQLNPLSMPAGPRGLEPVVAYSFDLQGASLLTQAQLTLSYPATPSGTLLGAIGSPNDLGPYWLQDSGNWMVMGPVNVDPTLHTVQTVTTHLSTFGLFLSASNGPAAWRPAERIITPHGANPIAHFTQTGASEVKIFDVRGRRVRTLGPLTDWNGTDDEGHEVESGVYIYQYTSQGTRVSGVIMVAK